MKTISAIINARLGSTRLPRKLIKPFAGSTLIDIALDKLNRMDFFHHRFFAVAEDELKTYAKVYPNVELLKRDPDSVKPGFQAQKIIYKHYLSIPSDYIFWINPCQPLLKIDTVKVAFEYVMTTSYNSYTAAYSFRDWVFDSDGNCLTNKDPAINSTAHTGEYYKMSHSFHIYNRRFFETTDTIWSLSRGDPHLIFIDREEAYDIDRPIEFQVTEAAYLNDQTGRDDVGIKNVAPLR